MIMIIKFIFNCYNFSVIVCFLSKLLTSRILFPTVVHSTFVANPLTLGILFSTIVNAVFVAKLLISGILPSILAILA